MKSIMYSWFVVNCDLISNENSAVVKSYCRCITSFLSKILHRQTGLQAGKLLFLFLIGALEFFVDLITVAALINNFGQKI